MNFKDIFKGFLGKEANNSQESEELNTTLTRKLVTEYTEQELKELAKERAELRLKEELVEMLRKELFKPETLYYTEREQWNTIKKKVGISQLKTL